ncbi:Qat anti-phage system associated protein QatB [Otariodibacter sp.]|uniref:Qat anti-phage system associated protein QatB n=1 Tax=Otariodibacter sp. TaxID=3030919 RepID=UPI00260A8698|nr:Qat anti-phage system associated protein QatB [Otariodibacter sp.]
MGTSSSSSGPKGGVQFDPPWLNTVATDIGSPLEMISGGSAQSEQNPQQNRPDTQSAEIAPHRRFGNARRHLGEYVSSGNRVSLRKALGSYSRKGMGGASKLASRMRTSTSAGAGLFNFLQGVRDSEDIKVRDWVNQLTSKNLSAHEVTDEIIEQVISAGGSLDEESCRDSMAQAMSDFLTINPDVDLLNMNNDSIWTVIELFMANEAFNRINLDIGQLFESDKYSPREAVSRMNDMRDYLKSEISAQIQELRKGTSNPTKTEINSLLQSAIKITFEVFEEGV